MSPRRGSSSARIRSRVRATTSRLRWAATRQRPTYTVPSDRRAQLIYLRAGNSSPEMIALTLLRDGTPMRVFPIGAKAAEHVPLAVVEDLMPETRLNVMVAAPEGASGVVVLDMGLVEI